MNPYLILNLPAGAEDGTIRQAYLKAIKESPPDSDPTRFQAVSKAYDQIKDRGNRHRHILFNRASGADSPLDALGKYGCGRRQFDPLPFEEMKRYLLASAKSGQS